MIFALVLLLLPAHQPGDLYPVMTRGHRLFQEKKCGYCHSIRGVGGTIGSDLSRTMKGKSYYEIAGSLWTHAPFMRDRMKELGLPWPEMKEKEISDLFTFLFYLNFFDLPGDEENGERLFSEKQCHLCHRPSGVAPAPEAFPRQISNLQLATMLWDHAPRMIASLKKRNVRIPQFFGNELTDIFAYLQMEGTGPELPFSSKPGTAEGGAKVFRRAGCISCHSIYGKGGHGGGDLSEASLRYSMTQIVGVMWNHYPSMAKQMQRKGVSHPDLEAGDLADLITYLYTIKFRGDGSDPVRGKEVFRSSCGPCHSFHGEGRNLAPDLTPEANGTEEQLLVDIWNALPNMVKLSREEGIDLDKLNGEDAADLFSYLLKGENQH